MYSKKNNSFDFYQFGIDNEDKLIILFNDFFNCKFCKGDKYSTYDFYSDEKILELKSRRCNKDKYDTTFINYNKIKNIGKYKELNKVIYFIFNYIDGIYYIKYDPVLFKDFKIVDTYTTNCNFSKGMRKNIEIPITHLNFLASH